jgi:hypothetical protein
MMQFSTFAVAAAHAFLFLSAFYGDSDIVSANSVSANFVTSTSSPSRVPTFAPSSTTSPSRVPTFAPSSTTSPSRVPTFAPSSTTSPSRVPTFSPSAQPSLASCSWATWANVSVDILIGEGTCLSNRFQIDGRLHSIGGVWSNCFGDVFVVDPVDNCVNKWDHHTGETHNYIGGGFGLSLLDLDAPFIHPQGITGSSDGRFLFISDLYHIWQFDTATGILTRFAGALLELSASIGDGDTADIAILDHPAGIWLASNGHLYIAESGSGKVRKIDEHYIISTCAGGGLIGYGGDGELAHLLKVKLNLPSNVYVTPDGCIYIADCNNNRVRIVGVDGIINTFAGGGLSVSDDHCLATDYSFTSIGDICGDDAGNIFVSEPGRYQILRISLNGFIQIIVGAGHPGINLVSVPADYAIISPTSLCWDSVNCCLLEVEADLCVVKRTHHHHHHVSPTYAPTQKVPTVPSAPHPSVPFVSSAPTVVRQPITPNPTPVFKPSTARPSISTVPTSQPSSSPSLQPTDPAVCKGKYCHDHIKITGSLVLRSCACNTLSAISLELIIQALNDCSFTPQTCDIVSTSPYHEGGSRLLRVFDFISLSASSSGGDGGDGGGSNDTMNDFTVNFNNDYEMKYYSGQTSYAVATTKEKGVRNSIEDETFQERLRQLATIHNNSELAQVTANSVQLQASVVSPDDFTVSSDTRSRIISNGAVAGITIGCVVAGVVGLMVVYHFYHKSKEIQSEEVAQFDSVSEDPEEANAESESEGEGRSDCDSEGEGDSEGDADADGGEGVADGERVAHSEPAARVVSHGDFIARMAHGHSVAHAEESHELSPV